jgi:hypothetical protein
VPTDINFSFTIRNQFTTSLSSLQAAYEMRKELLEYQRDFYINAKMKVKKKNKSLYIRRCITMNELAKY